MDGTGHSDIHRHAIDYGMTTKSGFSGIKDTSEGSPSIAASERASERERGRGRREGERGTGTLRVSDEISGN